MYHSLQHKTSAKHWDRIVPIPAISYSTWRALRRLCQLCRGQVVTDAFPAPLTCVGFFFMARVLDPFSAGPADRTGWVCLKVQSPKRKSYLVKGKLDGSVGLLSSLWKVTKHSFPSCMAQVSFFWSQKSQQGWLLACIRREQERLHVQVLPCKWMCQERTNAPRSLLHSRG